MAIGSRLRGILDELIATGYPDEVAERIVDGTLDMRPGARAERQQDLFPEIFYSGTTSPNIIDNEVTNTAPQFLYMSRSPGLAASYAGRMKDNFPTYQAPSVYPFAVNTQGMDRVLGEGATWNTMLSPQILPGGEASKAYRVLEDDEIPFLTTTDDVVDYLYEMGGSGTIFDRVQDVGPYQRLLKASIPSKTGTASQFEIDNYMRELEANPPTNLVVPDTSRVRALYGAAFDPEYTGSNILGGAATAAVGAGLLAAPEEAEAGVLSNLIKAGYPEEVAQRIASGELPMDYASRMGRAREQGYSDDVFYKGMYPYDYTKESEGYLGPVISEIKRPSPFPSFGGSDGDINIAGFMSKDSDVASRFAGPNVTLRGAIFPLRTKNNAVGVIDAKGKNAGDVQFGESGRPFRDMVRSGEYDSVAIQNTADEGDVYIALKPSNVRSLFAAFDPEYKGSNILGDRAIPVAGAGLLAAAAMAPEEAEAGVIKAFGREFDPRFDPRAKEQERLRDAVFSIEERGTQDRPRLALSSLEGRPFVTTQSDRTQAGGLLTAINDVDLNVPVDLRGGQGFMFENPAAWASGGNVITSLMKARDEFPGETPLLLPYRMTPTGGDFATMTGETMISYASANMTNKTKKQLDKQIKELIPEWKGVDNPESIKQFQNAKTNVRKYIQQQVMDVNFRNEGGLSIGEARLAVTDPKQAQAGDLQIQNIGEIFAGARTPSDHPAYPFNLPGQGLGYTDQEVNIFELMPEARVGADQRFVADPQRPTRSDARALEMKPYTGRITEDILRGLEARGVNINANPIATAAAVAAGQEAEGLLAQLPEKDTDEFNYGDILPIKRAKDPEEREGLLGGYSPAYTGIVEDMVEGLLKFSTQAKRGLYNPTAATEFLL
jgi:hypothetical protein